MASIRKRGTKYHVQIRRKGYAPLTRSFIKKADAEAWARHQEALLDRGDIPQCPKQLRQHTVKSILERYKAEISPKKKSFDSERYVLEALIRQPFTEMTLDRISANEFAVYREGRLKLVKAGTVNRELAIAKHAFDLAMKEWNIPLKENPLSKLKKLKVDNARSRRLQDEEWEAIERAIERTRNRHILDFIKLAMFTGMRRGEILRLKWQDIDFKQRTLFIPVTKNGYSRTIPLSSQALEVLAGRLELSEEAIKPDQSVFPLTVDSIKMAWKRLVKRAGISDLHFHDLRHEAISRFFERGLSVPEVATISGHRDFRMLYRYTHLKPEEIAKKLT